MQLIARSKNPEEAFGCDDELSTERGNDLVGPGQKWTARPHTLLFGSIGCRQIFETIESQKFPRERDLGRQYLSLCAGPTLPFGGVP
jgi:hypothetical protein